MSATTFGPPSPLVGAILDRQLQHMLAMIGQVKAGASRAELDRLGAEVNAAIRRDLVEPHGAAGRLAAQDAADRMLAVVHLLAEHYGVDLDADDAARSSEP